MKKVLTTTPAGYIRPEDMSLEGLRGGLCPVVAGLYERANDLMKLLVGYDPADRNSKMEAIVRLSLIARNNSNPEVQKELNDCLDEFEKKYRWLWK
jgi:hypothetical protein